jgi:hypothetical protein
MVVEERPADGLPSAELVQPPAQAKGKGSDLWLLVLGLGALGWIAACFGIVYAATGELMAGDGFKGVLLGTGLGFLTSGLFLIPGVALPGAFWNRSGRIVAAILLASATFAHAWLVLLPLLGRNPSSFFGAPDSVYTVTFSDGRQTEKSGAELGSAKWSFAAGAHTGGSLAGAVAALVLLLKGILGGRRKSA